MHTENASAALGMELSYATMSIWPRSLWNVVDLEKLQLRHAPRKAEDKLTGDYFGLKISLSSLELSSFGLSLRKMYIVHRLSRKRRREV